MNCQQPLQRLRDISLHSSIMPSTLFSLLVALLVLTSLFFAQSASTIADSLLQAARLMIEHDVGVTIVNTYAVKRIDSDYFEEE